jgi:cobalamin biosynthesis Mg chelatase CobN
MRARIRLAAVVLAFACFTGVAYADGPGGVYNDFAQDGKLSCNHSRADLLAVLRSGSINQYGDPYTLARLKLAVRRQLAGGCRAGLHRGRAVAGTGTGRGSGSGASTTGATGTQTSGAGSKNRSSASSGRSGRSASQRTVSTEGNGDFVTGRALLAVLLAGGLALAGWLTRRALAARH